MRNQVQMYKIFILMIQVLAKIQNITHPQILGVAFWRRIVYDFS